MNYQSNGQAEHIIFVNQIVRDYKIPPSEALKLEIGKLSDAYKRHQFIPSNKLTAKLHIKSLKNGIALCEISNFAKRLDFLIRHPFPLGIETLRGTKDAANVFAQVPGVEIDNGGNIQNMAVNLALLLLSPVFRDFIQKNANGLRLSIVSTSDPFIGFPKELEEAIDSFCTVYQMNLPDRIAYHLPYDDPDGQSGTFIISSAPLRTNDALRDLIEHNPELRNDIKNPTCFVASDPIDDVISSYVRPPYAYIINASTAFRGLVATTSFGHDVVLPMNNGEAADVCRLLLQRGQDLELDEILRPPFESPFTTAGDEIDLEFLRQLDESLNTLTIYNPLHRNLRRQAFTCPITFGADGGLVVGTGQLNFACYTTTPYKENVILQKYGHEKEIEWNKIFEAGAGDSVATIIALFNTITPHIFLEPHLKGRESKDQVLKDLAATIFVSCLGRIAGTFLVHNKKTIWSNIRSDKFYELFDDAAVHALLIARKMVRRIHTPFLAEIKE